GAGPWPTRHWRVMPVMQPGPRGGDPVVGDSHRQPRLGGNRGVDPVGETAFHWSPLGPRRLCSHSFSQGSRHHEPTQASGQAQAKAVATVAPANAGHGHPQPMGKAAALHEAKQWLRNLSASDALERLGTLTKGVVRGERPARQEMHAVPQPKDGAKDYKPYVHPRYWAAFILIGDPE